MKKLIVLILLALLIGGCSPEFYKHDSIFKDWSHWGFSWWGYRSPDAEDASNSAENGWWGAEIPYIPAE
ncbi:MAG: hypothetical protein JSV83_11835 [Desulfobacterales bacterium]|nr:MAG: hypothetical protein JSV83_11835 [Desulfobacterales bacterium]